MSEVQAYVTEENGHLVLHDPVAEAVVAAVEEHNRAAAQAYCQYVYEQNLDRIAYFRQRFDDQGYRPEECCIVFIQVDDAYGRPIAERLMPRYNWQVLHDQGLDPFARGITDRKFIREAIAAFDMEAAMELDTLTYAVVVVAKSVAKVFAV